MKKIVVLLIAVQVLAFNAFAAESKRHIDTNNESEVEDLTKSNDSVISSYLGTKDVHGSRKAKVHTASTTSPLMFAHTNPINVMSTVNTTLIFWGKSWANQKFTSDKVTGLRLFYSGLDSSNYVKTVSEYTTLFLNAPTLKTDSLTSASNSPSAVLSEVCKLIGSNNIDSKQGYYPVYTDIKRGTANYCAYHSAGTCGGKPVQFAFFFNLNDDAGCDPQSPYAPARGTTGSQLPGSVAGGTSGYQQSQGLAALANVTAHELAETATDPAYFPAGGSPYWGGWYDSTGAENGDKCAWTFGPSSTGLSPGTVFISGYDWKLQGEWSNSAYGSQTGYDQLKGCVTGS
jgi:hypothetical protein